jgi:site-specific DNA recombinase
MNGVIYARYSSEGQREESIEGQIRECREYCEKNGISIIQNYIDRAYSAKTDNRPAFLNMIRDSAKGLFDVVVVWKLDRFARNRYDSAHYKAALKKNGVRVISAKENIADGPEGIILESMLEGMAEYYSAELSVKVLRGHTENALKCKYNGGTPTFGYSIDADRHYQTDNDRATIVLEIFKQYDSGKTMKEIMKWLQDTGVTTVRGKKVDLNFVAAILHNRKYIGEYRYRDIVTPGGIPVIVPQELFNRVQDRLVKNKKAPARHKADDDYLLTTKLFCGTCKAFMVGESGTGESKEKYRYYRCVNTKRHKTCNAKRKTVRKQPIEDAVVKAVMEKIMDDNFLNKVAEAVMNLQTHESSALPLLKKQLGEVERGIQNMLNAIQAGIFNSSTKQRLDELEKEKSDLELNIAQEEMQRPVFTREQVICWLEYFRKTDIKSLDSRRILIDRFVNAVVVYDDYILITFNYKDGTKRISFSDIESSDLSLVGGPKTSEIS